MFRKLVFIILFLLLLPIYQAMADAGKGYYDQTITAMPITDINQDKIYGNIFSGNKIKYMVPIPQGGIESILPEGLRVLSKTFVPGGVNPSYTMYEIWPGLVTENQDTGILSIDNNRGVITPIDKKIIGSAGAVVGFKLDFTNIPQVANAKYFAFYVYPNSEMVNLDLDFTFSYELDAQEQSDHISDMFWGKQVLMGRLPNPLKEEESPRLVVINLDKLRIFSRNKLLSIIISFNNGPWNSNYFRDNIPAVLSNLTFIGLE